MEDWVHAEEVLVACYTKKGLPSAVAEELVRRTDFLRNDGSETQWLYIFDYQVIAHRIGERYFLPRADFARLMDLIVPDDQLIDLAASGDWQFEE